MKLKAIVGHLRQAISRIIYFYALAYVFNSLGGYLITGIMLMSIFSTILIFPFLRIYKNINIKQLGSL